MNVSEMERKELDGEMLINTVIMTLLAIIAS